MFVLRVLTGSAANAQIKLRDGKTVRFGRLDSCNVRIHDSACSKLHCELSRDGDGLMLRDLGSSNGTRVNGTKIASPTRLKIGDRIAVGKCEFVVEELRDDPPRHAVIPETTAIESEPRGEEGTDRAPLADTKQLESDLPAEPPAVDSEHAPVKLPPTPVSDAGAEPPPVPPRDEAQVDHGDPSPAPISLPPTAPPPADGAVSRSTRGRKLLFAAAAAAVLTTAAGIAGAVLLLKKGGEPASGSSAGSADSSGPKTCNLKWKLEEGRQFFMAWKMQSDVRVSGKWSSMVMESAGPLRVLHVGEGKANCEFIASKAAMKTSGSDLAGPPVDYLFEDGERKRHNGTTDELAVVLQLLEMPQSVTISPRGDWEVLRVGVNLDAKGVVAPSYVGPLLPWRQVGVGDTWEWDLPVEGRRPIRLTCKLASLENGRARITVDGTQELEGEWTQVRVEGEAFFQVGEGYCAGSSLMMRFHTKDGTMEMKSEFTAEPRSEPHPAWARERKGPGISANGEACADKVNEIMVARIKSGKIKSRADVAAQIDEVVREAAKAMGFEAGVVDLTRSERKKYEDKLGKYADGWIKLVEEPATTPSSGETRISYAWSLNLQRDGELQGRVVAQERLWLPIQSRRYDVRSRTVVLDLKSGVKLGEMEYDSRTVRFLGATEDRAFFQYKGRIRCLDHTLTTKLWELERRVSEDVGGSDPRWVTVDNSLGLLCLSGDVHAIALKTGNELWTARKRAWCSTAGASLLFAFVDEDGRGLVLVDRYGKDAWTKPFRQPGIDVVRSWKSGILAVGYQHQDSGIGFRDAEWHLLDPQTGETLWSVRQSNNDFVRPLVHEDALLLIKNTYPKEVAAVDWKDGKVRWRFSEPDVEDYSLVENTLMAQSRAWLYGLGVADGKKLWESEDLRYVGSLSSNGRTFAVAMKGDRGLLLDPSDGRVVGENKNLPWLASDSIAGPDGAMIYARSSRHHEDPVSIMAWRVDLKK
ncbi:MAG: FHA domain-containing protein [Planctomycetes bacterium]|nr:FHA domain-containing protein [Planctomycetota bacterium]